jgi:CRISPR-associated protein Csd1
VILQALAGYYERLLDVGADGIAPYGYSPEKISYEIVLAADGRVAAVNDIRDTSAKKPRPRVMIVPQPPKRASNIAPGFLWDKSSYVLGTSATSKRSEQEHGAFKALHLKRLGESNDIGLRALQTFLQNWTPEQFADAGFTADMLDTNMVFRLDGERQYLHERPAARAAWRQTSSSGIDAISDMCLVTGRNASIARLHPSIKGVRGAQSSGASIVSFNQNSFTSYGKAQGANAPVSEEAAFAYTTALNYLLRPGEQNRQRLQIGDTTVVFWAEADDVGQAEEAELTFGLLLNGPTRTDDGKETALIRNTLENVAHGRPLSDLNPELQDGTRMYVLGLAPNASRLSIRFWEVGTLGDFARRLAQHAEDFQIEPLPWNTAPSVWRIVLATVPNRTGAKPKMEDAAANLAGEFLRAVLSGGLYPRSLLASTLMRIRSDHNVSGLRAAICKAIPCRERRLGLHLQSEEPPVSLNKESTHPGYRLGRLFAVLEDAQRGALGGHVNATIRDRYYGAASATPASVFPILLRNAQNHLGKLRREKPGFAVNLEKDITDIIGGLPGDLPRSLPIEAQGQFAIGYYHQSQTRFQKSTKESDTTATEEASA